MRTSCAFLMVSTATFARVTFFEVILTLSIYQLVNKLLCEKVIKLLFSSKVGFLAGVTLAYNQLL